jgi:hypothetical protein
MHRQDVVADWLRASAASWWDLHAALGCPSRSRVTRSDSGRDPSGRVDHDDCPGVLGVGSDEFSTREKSNCHDDDAHA